MLSESALLYTCRDFYGISTAGSTIARAIHLLDLIVHSLDFRWNLQRLVGSAHPTVG